mmetsp:Transcript_15898/g.37498  ORF Transcript_15898/g.37498 Transcript_15898/m.37498 type:complete len:206 (+) Transcript_15898:236-853(+)
MPPGAKEKRGSGGQKHCKAAACEALCFSYVKLSIPSAMAGGCSTTTNDSRATGAADSICAGAPSTTPLSMTVSVVPSGAAVTLTTVPLPSTDMRPGIICTDSSEVSAAKVALDPFTARRSVVLDKQERGTCCSRTCMGGCGATGGAGGSRVAAIDARPSEARPSMSAGIGGAGESRGGAAIDARPSEARPSMSTGIGGAGGITSG